MPGVGKIKLSEETIEKANGQVLLPHVILLGRDNDFWKCMNGRVATTKYNKIHTSKYGGTTKHGVVG